MKHLKVGILAGGILSLAAIIIASAPAARAQDNGQTPLSASPAILDALQSHRLIGNFGNPNPTPPNGVEVSEYQTLGADGAQYQRGIGWNEDLGDNILRVQTGSQPNGYTQVQFWVLPKAAPGCLVFGTREYDQHGRIVLNFLWRNDPGLVPPHARGYRPDIYPNAAIGGLPGDAFVRALGTPKVGASGSVVSQMTPYEIIKLDVWVTGTEKVTTPAGTFSAYKVAMRPDLSYILPVPKVVAAVMDSFLPKNTIYFEDKPPYRLLKFDGEGDQGAPRVNTELTRSFTAGQQNTASVANRPAL